MHDLPDKQNDELTLIGWREWLSLPEIGVTPIRAKIDTGARTSALHVEWMKVEDTSAGHIAEFETVFGSRKKPRSVVARAPVVDERTVRSSSGAEELRVVIRTHLELGSDRWPIDMTLTSRASMKFPMLLGRRAMAGRVKIDPSRSFILGRPRFKKKGSTR